MTRQKHRTINEITWPKPARPLRSVNQIDLKNRATAVREALNRVSSTCLEGSILRTKSSAGHRVESFDAPSTYLQKHFPIVGRRLHVIVCCWKGSGTAQQYSHQSPNPSSTGWLDRTDAGWVPGATRQQQVATRQMHWHDKFYWDLQTGGDTGNKIVYGSCHCDTYFWD